MKRNTARVSSMPPVELAGNSQVLIRSCEGIEEYEPETVKVRAGRRCIRICGQKLDLCNLTEFTVVVRGIVRSLEFED